MGEPVETLPQETMTTPLPDLAGMAKTRGTGFLSVLRNKSFLSLWSAQVTSQTAQNTLWYVLIIMVGNITHQNTLGVGVTIVLVQIPTVLFSSVAGVLVDRVPKKNILIGTNAVRVVGVLAYFLFQQDLVGLYLVTFAVAVISQPFAPAEGSTLPLLVRGEQLITANSLFQSTFMVSQAVGFAVGPVFIGLLGISVSLLVLAGLFAVAAIALLFLPALTAEHKEAPPIKFGELTELVWRDLAEAMHFIFQDSGLAVAILQLALAPTLLLLLAEVGQNFLKYNLGIQETGTSLFFLLAPAGVGLGLGLLVLGQWGHKLRKDRLVLISLIALGITVIGLASVSATISFWDSLRRAGLGIPRGVELTLAIIPVCALLGIEVSFITAPAQTIVQQRTKPEIRGRVLAVQQTLTAAIAIPPLIVVGGVAAIIGTPATLTIVGLMIISVGLALVYYA